MWLPFIRHCDIVIANSHNTAQLAREAGVLAPRLRIVYPGTDAPRPDQESTNRFRYSHKLGDVPLLLSVGRLTARKGLSAFVARSLPELVRQFPEVLLVVIGDEAQNALHRSAGSGREAILKAAKVGKVMPNIRLLGPCSESILNDAYDAADVLVFPVLEVPGDVEGFGMVAIEAAAHGTPTVAFAVGGVPDAVAEQVSGSLITPSDYAQFASAIQQWLEEYDVEDVEESCRSFASRFAWPRFAKQLRQALADEAPQSGPEVA